MDQWSFAVQAEGPEFEACIRNRVQLQECLYPQHRVEDEDRLLRCSGCPYSSRPGESRKESDREGHLVHSSGTCTHTNIYHIHTYMYMYMCVHSVFKCLNSYFADEEHVKMKVSIKAPRAAGETVKIKCDIRLQNFIGGCDGLSTPCASQERQHIQSRWKQEGTSCTSKHF